jgi:hypothetical protein
VPLLIFGSTSAHEAARQSKEFFVVDRFHIGNAEQRYQNSLYAVPLLPDRWYRRGLLLNLQKLLNNYKTIAMLILLLRLA